MEIYLILCLFNEDIDIHWLRPIFLKIHTCIHNLNQFYMVLTNIEMTTQYIQNKTATTYIRTHTQQAISTYLLNKDLTDVVKIYWEDTRESKYVGWISVKIFL